MKKIFLILFILVSIAGYSQSPTGLPTLFNGKWYDFTQYLQCDSGFFNPIRDTTFKPYRLGASIFRLSDSTLYVYTGKSWKPFGGNNGGAYTNGYGLKLASANFSVDTLVISTKAYAKKVADSSAAISNQSVKYTDTAAMLSGYKTFYPRKSISLTTTGSSGAATYNQSTGVLNVPQYSVPSGTVTGSGTTAFIPKWSSSTGLSNSIMQDDGSNHVAVGYTSNPSTYMLDVNGTSRFKNNLRGDSNILANKSLALSVSGSLSTISGYTTFHSTSTTGFEGLNFGLNGGGSPSILFPATSSNTYTFPDNTGTVALVSDIPNAPVIVAEALVPNNTDSLPSVISYTTPSFGNIHAYRINANVTVLADSVKNFNIEVQFTDEGGTARTIVLGAFSSANFYTYPSIIINAASTGTLINIKTVKTSGGGTITYNATGVIEDLGSIYAP